jgi:cardiolipin synthase A/B
MNIQLLVGFDSFWTSAARDISAARGHVFVQTFSFEGDSIGKKLAQTLVNSHAADKKILVDSFSKIVLSDKFLYAPVNWLKRELRDEARETERLHKTLASAGVQIRYGNSFGFSPRRCLTRNHKKVIVIDDRVSYIGGFNFSEHNASWHDMMVRIEDRETAEFFREDFLAAWKGEGKATTKRINGLELHTLDGRSNRSAFEKVLRLIDSAQASIFIESPYITSPFYDRLREARSRGVSVTIVTPKANNWSYFADYARWEAARCGIDLRLFKNGMSHLKAMLIDDRYLIAGSSNFDFLSYRIYQEIIAIFSEPGVIAEFRRSVLNKDLSNSEAPEQQTEKGLSWISLWRLRILTRSFAFLFD